MRKWLRCEGRECPNWSRLWGRWESRYQLWGQNRVSIKSGSEVIGQGMPASTRLAYLVVDMKQDKQDKEKSLRVWRFERILDSESFFVVLYWLVVSLTNGYTQPPHPAAIPFRVFSCPHLVSSQADSPYYKKLPLLFLFYFLSSLSTAFLYLTSHLSLSSKTSVTHARKSLHLNLSARTDRNFNLHPTTSPSSSLPRISSHQSTLLWPDSSINISPSSVSSHHPKTEFQP